MKVSELIAQLQALQAQHGDRMVICGENSEPWDCGEVVRVHFWPEAVGAYDGHIAVLSE